MRQPPHPAKYRDVADPHHLLGNLAEAYEKAAMPDSAVFYHKASLQKAAAIQAYRGMAVAHFSLGTVYLNMRQPDSAAAHFNAAITLSSKHDIPDCTAH